MKSLLKDQWLFSAKCALILLILFKANAISDETIVNNLSVADVLDRSHAVYASLATYRDDGAIVGSVAGKTTTMTFHIKMARPNLYRIETQSYPNSDQLQPRIRTVWCAGEASFQDLGLGIINLSEKIRKRFPKETEDMQISNCQTLSFVSLDVWIVPSLFFDLNSQDRALQPPSAIQRFQPSEKIGAEDCYVISSDFNEVKQTLWIGKRDFLIYQIRYFQAESPTNDRLIDALQDKIQKLAPNVPKIPALMSQGVTSTETHSNIVVNSKLVPDDFVK